MRLSVQATDVVLKPEKDTALSVQATDVVLKPENDVALSVQATDVVLKPEKDTALSVQATDVVLNPFAFTNCVCIGLAVFAFKALEIPCLFAFSGGKTQKCKYYY